MYHQLHFSTATGQIPLPVTNGDVILIAGPNGVGKSALLAAMYRSLPLGLGSYLPGHRQINFNSGSDALTQSLIEIQKNLFQHVDHFSRYKNAWAEDHFRSIIRRLSNAEAAFNRAHRKRAALGPTNERLQTDLNNSPIDILNVVFEAARLPIRFDATINGIEAIRGSEQYLIDALSDGERAALFIAAAIITQDPNTVLLIDEPEKHLNPGISAPFMQAAIRSRDDICIVMASHDVNVIDNVDFSRMVYIQDSNVLSQSPETRSYRAHIIESSSDIPEDLRTDILGSRSKMLFIEGDEFSLDIAMYSHVYKETKIIPKGGCEKVIEGVKALRSSSAQHWVSPFGLIDGDGRALEERQKLSENFIHCLPFPSIENLFFLDEAIECYVEASLIFEGGASLDERIKAIQHGIITEANASQSDIVAKRASWLVERHLNASKRSPKDLRSGLTNDIVIPVDSIMTDVRISVSDVISRGDWREIITTLPIKKTNLPKSAAKALGADSYRSYQRVVLRQMDLGSMAGIALIDKLAKILPRIDGAAVVPPPRSSASPSSNVLTFRTSNRDA